MEGIKKTVERFIKPGFEYELFLQRIKKTKIESSDESLENISTSEELGLGIRVLKDKKMGFSYTSSLDEEDIKSALSRAMEMCELQTEDEGNAFVEKFEESDIESVYDEEGVNTPLEEKIEFTINLEKEAKKRDKRIKGVRKSSLTEAVFETHILNSCGVEVSYRGTSYSAMIATLAESNGDSAISWEFRGERKFKKLVIEDIVNDVVFKSTSLLNPEPVETKAFNIVFFRESFAMLMEAFTDIFLGDSLVKNKTLLKGKEGEKVASEKFTLIDDGTLKEGFMTVPYDDEGVKRRKNVIIEKGIFKGFLHSIYSGRLAGKSSTGNAVRGSYRNPPQSGITNLYVEKGERSLEELINVYDETILVLDLMGLHTVDPISGEFSLGASGVLFRNGKPVHAVRGITVAGNILDIWKNIEEVGNDLKFYGNVGSPSVLIKGIMVGGR